MSGLKIVTRPALAPISRIEARDHLRLDEDFDDGQVRAYIAAATEWAENYTGRALISRTMQMFLDGAPVQEERLSEGMVTGYSNVRHRGSITIPMSPVASVSSIKYYADDDTESTWASSNYHVDTISTPARIVLREGATYPTDLRDANGLEINFTAGYGTNPSDVPESIRVAILQYMTFLYEHRGESEGATQPKLPAVIHALLDPYKVIRFNASSFEAGYF
jgi:uncharacterized phiE125 gp8 family phage protein